MLKKHTLVYYSAVFPGVVFHELSHVIGCILTGTRIKRVSLFSKTGGFVEYEKSKLALISDLIISIMPFVLGFVAIFLTMQYAPRIDFSNSSIVILGRNILISYLLISIMLCMLPSFQDLKNASIGYMALIVVFAALNKVIFKFSISFEFVKVLVFCAATLIVINLIIVLVKVLKLLK